MMANKFKFIMAGACLMLLLAFCSKDNQSQPKAANLIPTPVELTVRSGSVCSNKLLSLPQKVKISEKALLSRLKGQKLTDWQIKSAYWMEIGKKKVKIEAADEQGVLYARQSLKMMAALDSVVNCCTIYCGRTGERTRQTNLNGVVRGSLVIAGCECGDEKCYCEHQAKYFCE